MLREGQNNSYGGLPGAVKGIFYDIMLWSLFHKIWYWNSTLLCLIICFITQEAGIK